MVGHRVRWCVFQFQFRTLSITPLSCLAFLCHVGSIAWGGQNATCMEDVCNCADMPLYLTTCHCQYYLASSEWRLTLSNSSLCSAWLKSGYQPLPSRLSPNPHNVVVTIKAATKPKTFETQNTSTMP